MLEYWLYVGIYPAAIFLAFVLLLALVGKKFPKFKDWVLSLEPSQDTKALLVGIAVVVLFYWAVNYR